ncbi:cysteine hydrolase family protein [Pseudochelatococcus sp. B33]
MISDPAKTALLVIDLQNEYRADGTYPVEGFAEILANTMLLMEAARRIGMPVWHIQAAVEEQEKPAYPLLHCMISPEFSSAVAGSRAAEICDEVAPAPGDVRFRKIWPSAFRNSDLEHRLRGAGIDTLFVTGVWTDSCVRATVFDAVFAGFRVWLIKDACGSGTRAMHRTAILDMANRLYGGGVTSTGRVIDIMQGRQASNWVCTRPVEFQYQMDTIDALYDAL